MKVLVIGGTGFIGKHVVQSLADRGCEVMVFHRGTTDGTLPEGTEVVTGDKAEICAFRETFEKFLPEVALDMIPMTEAEARETVEAVKGIAKRTVAVSSQDVYRAFGILIRVEEGEPEPLPITEDSPLRSHLYPYRGIIRTPWADQYDKILVEKAFTEAVDLPTTVLRLPAVYGPGDRQHRFHAYLQRMDDQRPAILLEDRRAAWRWTHGYVENVADAIALAVTDDRAVGRIYNVGEPQALPTAEWVARLAHVAGWGARAMALPGAYLPEALREGENLGQDMVVDTTRIRDELGYREKISAREALVRTVQWERFHPPLDDHSRDTYPLEDQLIQGLLGGAF